MKKITISLLLIFISSTNLVKAQENYGLVDSLDISTLSPLQLKVLKMYKFYTSYQTPNSSNKKGLFKDAIEGFSDGKAKSEDVSKAFEIVDFYIKGSESLSSKEKDTINESDVPLRVKKPKKSEENIAKEEALESLNEAFNKIKSVSYNEYKAFINSDGLNIPEEDIVKSYNQFTGNDNLGIKTQNNNSLKTEELTIIQAIEIINNPKNLEEFKKAIKVVKPSLSEKEIESAWSKHHNK